jgi:hypothetical protein
MRSSFERTNDGYLAVIGKLNIGAHPTYILIPNSAGSWATASILSGGHGGPPLPGSCNDYIFHWQERLTGKELSTTENL